MDWLTDRPIAHRGLHSETVPENSIRAFEEAVDAGYPIECDVRLSVDGVPVVFHDSELDRMTDQRGFVSETTSEQLVEYSLLDSDESIPRFETVLETVDGAVPLLVELKTAGKSGGLESAVTDRLDAYDGEFAVQSFNPLTVAWFRTRRPGWPRGQLSGFFDGSNVGFLRRSVMKRLLPNLYTRPDFVGYNHENLPYPPVRRVRKRGKPVLGWTVRSAETFDRVEPYVDNVIFEEFRP